jgi:hypothetical protein
VKNQTSIKNKTINKIICTPKSSFADLREGQVYVGEPISNNEIEIYCAAFTYERAPYQVIPLTVTKEQVDILDKAYAYEKITYLRGEPVNQELFYFSSPGLDMYYEDVPIVLGSNEMIFHREEWDSDNAESLIRHLEQYKEDRVLK